MCMASLGMKWSRVRHKSAPDRFVTVAGEIIPLRQDEVDPLNKTKSQQQKGILKIQSSLRAGESYCKQLESLKRLLRSPCDAVESFVRRRRSSATSTAEPTRVEGSCVSPRETAANFVPELEHESILSTLTPGRDLVKQRGTRENDDLSFLPSLPTPGFEKPRDCQSWLPSHLSELEEHVLRSRGSGLDSACNLRRSEPTADHSKDKTVPSEVRGGLDEISYQVSPTSLLLNLTAMWSSLTKGCMRKLDVWSFSSDCRTKNRSASASNIHIIILLASIMCITLTSVSVVSAKSKFGFCCGSGVESIFGLFSF